jgi:plastocyanin
MRSEFLVGMTVAALCAWSCGGSSASPGGNPAAPAPVGDVPTINIVGDRGATSFSPNPASVAQGTMFVWRNMDNQVHHIVLNDGSLDSGDIAPGASSRVLRLDANGANYHCTIHPGMVGSINRSIGNPPPCEGPYC